jgi:hypothetical protein
LKKEAADKGEYIIYDLNSPFSAAEAKRLADEKLKKEAADKGTYIIYHLNSLFSAAEAKRLADEKLKKEAADKGKIYHQLVKLCIFSCRRKTEKRSSGKR